MPTSVGRPRLLRRRALRPVTACRRVPFPNFRWRPLFTGPPGAGRRCNTGCNCARSGHCCSSCGLCVARRVHAADATAERSTPRSRPVHRRAPRTRRLVGSAAIRLRADPRDASVRQTRSPPILCRSVTGHAEQAWRPNAASVSQVLATAGNAVGQVSRVVETARDARSPGVRTRQALPRRLRASAAHADAAPRRTCNYNIPFRIPDNHGGDFG